MRCISAGLGGQEYLSWKNAGSGGTFAVSRLAVGQRFNIELAWGLLAREVYQPADILCLPGETRVFLCIALISRNFLHHIYFGIHARIGKNGWGILSFWPHCDG